MTQACVTSRNTRRFAQMIPQDGNETAKAEAKCRGD